MRLFDMDSPEQGIVHVIGPELGLTQPGMTIVCGDSHTSTHGAFGALAFGIGTSEVEQIRRTGFGGGMKNRAIAMSAAFSYYPILIYGNCVMNDGGHAWKQPAVRDGVRAKHIARKIAAHADVPPTAQEHGPLAAHLEGVQDQLQRRLAIAARHAAETDRHGRRTVPQESK